ncbi:CHAT domain-containing protein [Actinoplanes sp. TRM 88003]|uniref:CHAT domain-containing protein n=1 Tax=Paractinoplanes aksuensis TaxID=2939490 RepID=A0ABT1E0Y8_9ACTN|nr:CHAT domain-containing protein [Actinoplanes aksuensis]
MLVSPDPQLLAVPWEALGLGLRFRLCRTPSLLRASGQPIDVPVRRALVVADPLGDLPAAAAEGARVAGLLRAYGVEVTELAEAGRDALARALPDFPLVHYAGHTDYLAADPASSHLVLADGPLTVGDLAGVTPAADAVFYLSSCESVRSGPDTLGLGAVLVVKGAAAVIGSNWPAGDAASAAMVEPFYAALLGGDTVAGALRSARATLAGRGEPIAAWALPAVIGQPFVRVRTPSLGP